MTESLKCIGGPLDGQRRVISDGQEVLAVCSMGRPSWRDLTASDPVDVRKVLYVRDHVNGPDGVIVTYLRPAGWTGAQALQYALGA